MRASTAIVAFSAYAGLTSAIDLSSCPTGIGYDTTPNILAIDTPALGKNVLVGNAFSITWHVCTSSLESLHSTDTNTTTSSYLT